jgi:hypothetical protein
MGYTSAQMGVHEKKEERPDPALQKQSSYKHMTALTLDEACIPHTSSWRSAQAQGQLHVFVPFTEFCFITNREIGK